MLDGCCGSTDAALKSYISISDLYCQYVLSVLYNTYWYTIGVKTVLTEDLVLCTVQDAVGEGSLLSPALCTEALSTQLVHS